jgi:hypothetical protein
MRQKILISKTMHKIEEILNIHVMLPEDGCYFGPRNTLGAPEEVLPGLCVTATVIYCFTHHRI